MKKLTVRLLFAAIITALFASCTQLAPLSIAAPPATEKSQPTFKGTPVEVDFRYHNAKVYPKGVKFEAKASDIHPSKVNVHDIDGDGSAETVYLLPTPQDYWQVYHRMRPTLGVTTVPNTMSDSDAQTWFWKAIDARNLARAKTPLQPRQTPPSERPGYDRVRP